MPYLSDSDLPKYVKDRVPSSEGRAIWRETFNEVEKDTKDGGRAASAAWLALNKAGYHKNTEGDYVKVENAVSKESTRDYLEQALRLAKQQLPGWAWAMIHQAARSHAGGKSRLADEVTKEEPQEESFEAETLDGSKVVFVVLDHNSLETARGKLLVGADGVTFNEVYLKALDLPRSDVGICTFTDLPADVNVPVVALGKAAKLALGKKAAFSMPHPTAIRKLGNSGEVDRKSKALLKLLTRSEQIVYNGTGEAETTSQPYLVEIAKTDEEKRIVYGVVLDPYKVDAHGDLIPPSEVEKTAHGWMSKSRVVGLQHSEMADAVPVESWLVPYPSDKDYKAAMAGEPHKATQSSFGSDVVHSGTWILGTRLGQEEWKAVKSGELNAYSIGGFGKRRTLNEADAPKVEFVEADSGEE